MGECPQALDYAQRRAFERWLTSREEHEADMRGPRGRCVEVERVAEVAPDQLSIKETEQEAMSITGHDVPKPL